VCGGVFVFFCVSIPTQQKTKKHPHFSEVVAPKEEEEEEEEEEEKVEEDIATTVY
jgi:hypothetical protein